MTMTIAFDVTLAIVALIASVYVGLEARNVLVDEVNWYIPGQWDVYHKGELVKSDCTMDEATDYVESDGGGRFWEDNEYRFVYHGEPASDGFEVSNRGEWVKGTKEMRRAARKAKDEGIISEDEYNRIVENGGSLYKEGWK